MKFLIVIIVIFAILFAFSIIQNKVIIKFHTFFKKGFKPTENKYGVYCYCGKQGSGKTYSVVGYLLENSDKVIYANLKSLDRERIKYTYIANLKEMLTLRSEHDIIIFFDEIFTEISKLLKTDNKLAKDILDFLSQMRKRRIILLTTCQEWRLLPLYFRLYCRFQINCRMIRLPFIKGIVIKNFVDGDNIKWSEEEQDFVGDLLQNVVEHTRKSVSSAYDTYEQIGEYSNYSTEIVSNDFPEGSNFPNDVGEDKGLDYEFWNDIDKFNDIERADTTTSPMSELCQQLKGVQNE